LSKANEGDWVQVHYMGKLVNGEIFDQSNGRPPLEFQIGGGQVIPGFEQATIGMDIGESKSIHIPSDEAYGPYEQDMVITVDRGEFPPSVDPMIGQPLQIQQQDGNVVIVTVKAVTESHVTLDANHPLAGEDLTFDIELVGISQEPTMDHGCPGCHQDNDQCCDQGQCDHDHHH